MTSVSLSLVRCNACLSRYYAALSIIYTPELARLTHTYEPEPPVRVVSRASMAVTHPGASAVAGRYNSGFDKAHPTPENRTPTLTTSDKLVLAWYGGVSTYALIRIAIWLAGFWP